MRTAAVAPDFLATSAHAIGLVSMTQPTSDKLLDSKALLQGAKAVIIVHNGTPYRLQSTKLGKLILTK